MSRKHIAEARWESKEARDNANVGDARVNIVPTCTYCQVMRPHMSFCARCKDYYYCSKECQRKDWSNHKKTCA